MTNNRVFSYSGVSEDHGAEQKQRIRNKMWDWTGERCGLDLRLAQCFCWIIYLFTSCGTDLHSSPRAETLFRQRRRVFCYDRKMKSTLFPKLSVAFFFKKTTLDRNPFHHLIHLNWFRIFRATWGFGDVLKGSLKHHVFVYPLAKRTGKNTDLGQKIMTRNQHVSVSRVLAGTELGNWNRSQQ